MSNYKCGNCKFWKDWHCINPLSIYGGDEMSPEAPACMEWSRAEMASFTVMVSTVDPEDGTLTFFRSLEEEDGDQDD